MRALLNRIATRLAHEPVAVWGTVIVAAAQVVGRLAHAPEVVDDVVTGLTLLGIPAVRSQVTPTSKTPAP